MPRPKIDSYQFGKIVINGKTYTKDVILLPDRVISDWWRKEGHRLQLVDLEKVITANPSRIIIGLGANSRMRVSSEVEQALNQLGIEMIALSTGDAYREYNQLDTDTNIAAALHLTC